MIVFCRLREEVIRKCRGVPFIAVCLGNRVQQENDRSKWTAILHEENWDSTGHLIGALRLSYTQLDSHLKPCFAYSSIVPQNFLFEEEWLIQHWMAQGFIQPNTSTDETIEDIGRSYFRSLVGRSFFQRAHVDRTGERQSYSLSEMMQDLARHVSGEDCKCNTIIQGPYNIPEKVRYLTVVFNMPASQDMFEVISGGKCLHTLIVVGGSERFELKIPTDIAKRFIRLRALDLSNFCVTELPESIGELKHLRCLQLRNTKIRRLPESVCDLYSLQTLGLTNCYNLEELPRKIKNLRMIRHIDLVMARNVCSLEGMPKGIGLLDELQTLSRFVVSLDTHRGSIAELADLNKLCGELLISNLHLVESVQEAVLAKLASKQRLQKLELSWSHSNKNAEEILERLKPPTNVKELTMSGYTGMACPSWLGSAQYTNVVTVCLYDFKRCTELPPLGLLPALKNLHLKGWASLVSINCSIFCGRSTPSFPSLKKLHLERMDRLQLWDGDERCAFPSLLELILENCCRLKQVTHSLPSLAKITVEGSLHFCGFRRYPSLKHVNVNASGRFHTSLQRLEISQCEQLVSIPEDWPPCNLIHFSVRDCPKLRELPRGIRRLKALEDMEIIACGQLTCLPEMGGLISLLRLEISECGLIQSLPDMGLPSSCLDSDYIWELLMPSRLRRQYYSLTVSQHRTATTTERLSIEGSVGVQFSPSFL
uniref:NB-ARC domain-containing protein n=1 Tax=Setaria italica TaxID=4555 RepID=K4AKJ5_SETIT